MLAILRGILMFNNLWSLALLCSTGSILVVLGIILKVPLAIQLLMLLSGIIICGIGVFKLAKYILGDR